MVPILFLVLAKSEWQRFRVNEAQLGFVMPAKPERRESVFHNATAIYYSADSPEGHFVAGYAMIPAPARPAMHKMIVADPGGEGVKRLLSMAVAEFAKAGNAKIIDPEFGLDKGLPTEFATLSNGRIILKMRVYLGSSATYLFVSRAADPISERYFAEVKLPAEIQKN